MNSNNYNGTYSIKTCSRIWGVAQSDVSIQDRFPIEAGLSLSDWRLCSLQDNKCDITIMIIKHDHNNDITFVPQTI